MNNTNLEMEYFPKHQIAKQLLRQTVNYGKALIIKASHGLQTEFKNLLF